MNYFEPFKNTGDALSWGLSFSLFGFAMVFVVLAIIMFIVILFGKVFSGVGKSKATQSQQPKKVEKKVAPKPQPEAEPVPAVENVAVTSDNGGIVAAIMAAISAYRGANSESGGFRVVSFKKRK